MIIGAVHFASKTALADVRKDAAFTVIGADS
jgi:hypothetical protein